jgi:hypothetical protein
MDFVIRKRKSIEVTAASLPQKVQKLEPLLQTAESASQHLKKYSETLKRNLCDDGVDSLRKWLENAETEIEIKIESIKIQFDILEEKMLSKIDTFEALVLHDKQKLREISKLRGKKSVLCTFEKICKFFMKTTGEDLTLKAERAREFKLSYIGAIKKYTPINSTIEEGTKFGLLNLLAIKITC